MKNEIQKATQDYRALIQWTRRRAISRVDFVLLLITALVRASLDAEWPTDEVVDLVRYGRRYAERQRKLYH